MLHSNFLLFISVYVNVIHLQSTCASKLYDDTANDYGDDDEDGDDDDDDDGNNNGE